MKQKGDVKMEQVEKRRSGALFAVVAIVLLIFAAFAIIALVGNQETKEKHQDAFDDLLDTALVAQPVPESVEQNADGSPVVTNEAQQRQSATAQSEQISELVEDENDNYVYDNQTEGYDGSNPEELDSQAESTGETENYTAGTDTVSDEAGYWEDKDLQDDLSDETLFNEGTLFEGVAGTELAPSDPFNLEGSDPFEGAPDLEADEVVPINLDNILEDPQNTGNEWFEGSGQSSEYENDSDEFFKGMQNFEDLDALLVNLDLSINETTLSNGELTIKKYGKVEYDNYSANNIFGAPDGQPEVMREVGYEVHLFDVNENGVYERVYGTIAGRDWVDLNSDGIPLYTAEGGWNVEARNSADTTAEGEYSYMDLEFNGGARFQLGALALGRNVSVHLVMYNNDTDEDPESASAYVMSYGYLGANGVMAYEGVLVANVSAVNESGNVNANIKMWGVEAFDNQSTGVAKYVRAMMLELSWSDNDMDGEPNEAEIKLIAIGLADRQSDEIQRDAAIAAYELSIKDTNGNGIGDLAQVGFVAFHANDADLDGTADTVRALAYHVNITVDETTGEMTSIEAVMAAFVGQNNVGVNPDGTDAYDSVSVMVSALSATDSDADGVPEQAAGFIWAAEGDGWNSDGSYTNTRAAAIVSWMNDTTDDGKANEATVLMAGWERQGYDPVNGSSDSQAFFVVGYTANDTNYDSNPENQSAFILAAEQTDTDSNGYASETKVFAAVMWTNDTNSDGITDENNTVAVYYESTDLDHDGVNETEKFAFLAYKEETGSAPEVLIWAFEKTNP